MIFGKIKILIFDDLKKFMIKSIWKNYPCYYRLWRKFSNRG
jgi:hypothetical protein